MFHRSMLATIRISARSLWLAVSLAAGSAAVYLVVRQAGFSAIAQAIRSALGWLPLVLAIEGFRIATEVMAAKSLFTLVDARVPKAALIRAQLVGYAICNMVPVGRMASEAAK